MRKVYFLIFTCCFSITVFSQKNGTIKGIAFDTISRQPVTGATITLMEQKDSSLVSFTMTGVDGKFELKGIANGTYRLMLSHVNYHNSNKYITISENNKHTELGNVVMNDNAKVLEEVVLASEPKHKTLIKDTIT